VAITPNTVRNFPQSLNVYSVAVQSPVDSFNTLLLNYAGVDAPLTVSGSMMIGSNSALTMLSSAIHLAGPPGWGLSVGGQVNHNEFSRLTGSQFDVGWIGPGVYDLNSGVVDVGHVWVGGPHAGVFNQNGGIFTADVLHLEPGGKYNLRGGDFDALTYITGNTQPYVWSNTEFRQYGGYVYRRLEVFRGVYRLNGGVNFGGVTVPVASNAAGDDGYAYAYQAGGVNLGPILLGLSGVGIYVLSNGVVEAPSITVARWGQFSQIAGTVTTPGTITVDGVALDRERTRASYGLSGGSLFSTGIRVDTASFGQGGGTNAVDGRLTVGPGTHDYEHTGYGLYGGLLTTENTTVDCSPIGGFHHDGGIHRIANELSIAGEVTIGFPPSRTYGYELFGGELIASNIVVHPRSRLTCVLGTVKQSGTIRLIGGQLKVRYGPYQFGPLQLDISDSWTSKDSTIHMMDWEDDDIPESGIVRFRNSSAMPWASNARLIITNWYGSLQGGGADQVFFGSSAAGLTPAQLGKILFQNPAGFTGMYAARILATGEIVPDMRTGANSPRLSIRKPASNLAIVTVTGDPGKNYAVYRSANLINWVFWTNRVATNGTMTVHDTATFDSRRFYKAMVLP